MTWDVLGPVGSFIEERYVVTVDIPGAFLQTDMPEDDTAYTCIRIDGHTT